MDVKRYKYQEKSRTSPPKTIRYCDICTKKTTWVFNPHIGHSQCEECGYRKISDTLINYEGRIMENKSKDTKTNKQSYLSKLLNKTVKCTLLNLDIMEGILIDISQYEIVMLIADEQVIIFKHGILTIREYKQDL